MDVISSASFAVDLFDALKKILETFVLVGVSQAPDVLEKKGSRLSVPENAKVPDKGVGPCVV
ncbi:hypothetical protein AA102526_2569 [Asaia lannensis NBRC 102526]|nr:hypothetical protein AA102526_2569 [Asaia lannensis NBRC 102526]